MIQVDKRKKIAWVFLVISSLLCVSAFALIDKIVVQKDSVYIYNTSSNKPVKGIDVDISKLNLSNMCGNSSNVTGSYINGRCVYSINISVGSGSSGGFTTDQNTQLNTTGSPTFNNITITNMAVVAGIISNVSQIIGTILDDPCDVSANWSMSGATISSGRININANGQSATSVFTVPVKKNIYYKVCVTSATNGISGPGFPLMSIVIYNGANYILSAGWTGTNAEATSCGYGKSTATQSLSVYISGQGGEDWDSGSGYITNIKVEESIGPSYYYDLIVGTLTTPVINGLITMGLSGAFSALSGAFGGANGCSIGATGVICGSSTTASYLYKGYMILRYPTTQTTNLRIDSMYTGDDAWWRFTQARVTTTSATPTELWNYTNLDNNKILHEGYTTMIEANIIAANIATVSSGQREGAAYKITCAFIKNATAAYQIGTTNYISTHESVGASSWNPTCQPKGNTVSINVTGETGKTINWEANIQLSETGFSIS